MNPYDYDYDSALATRRRRIIEHPLYQPDPVLQPALNFEPPQPATPVLTIEARFIAFHRQNPHIYAELREMALELAAAGWRHISPKFLVEQLRFRGITTITGDTYRLNNIYTSHYARMLADEPELCGRIPIRKLKAA